ncbi:molybdopterin molybdotransferase MoeA [Agreia sp. Leaf210]|uniref:molybdopterin molybdotransferase MoeA n=1 Tax=Agreia sp. Leaf210 TaxID=1735682 RepID=UPI0009E8484A|nr:molybdopterin molybdotransferase MoeA [Agreia sp. Leaf210]
MSAASGAPRMPWARAREAAFGAADPRPATRVALRDAVGRVLAEPVLALCDVPHYASSAMDGWAVRGPGPWVLRGAARDASALEPNEAREIVTGGLIPSGAEAVLRSEVGEVAADGGDAGGPVLRSTLAPWAGQHIRPRGEEFARGEVGIEAGARLNPAHIAVAAACGVDEVEVLARGRVSLVFTGDEVVTHGIPAPGTVRDSFGPQLPAFVELLGGEVAAQARIGDDQDALVGALLADASTSDVVITTGGTGDSSADHLRGALDRLGAGILIDGVAMRPGGPSLLARLDDGRLLIGLPGNPLAAMMGLLTLAAPALAALGGRGMPELSRIRLGAPIAAGRGETRLVPFRLVDGRAQPSGFTGSAMLRGLADASGVLLCADGGAEVGDEVEFVPLPWV